ncbi:uncharacterized protein TNCV_2085321 [Trichonephila clavipes]|uniref:DUF4817 domain-containing protein n=1 Tax=Trichonephila clavipes TaxID=2585209 RepID=A0A8X6RVT0_TRICX|nr:uncharacterized protein TNCV_2085321 [Trichonephila clavipes]
MAVTLPERALLVKLFYESKGNAAAALREFRRLKNLRKGPLLPQVLKIMITRFEKTGHLGVQPGRGRKSTRSDVVEDVATAIVDQSMHNVIGCSSVRAVSRHLGVPYSTVVEVDASWPWKILWSDEAHFHLSGTVNTHNCRIWDTENPRTFQDIPLHSPKVTVWCGFTAKFILGPFLFEKTTRNGPVTCTVMARSRAFQTAWSPRSPDLNPCDFRLWGYLKNLVYRGRLITLADLKDSITLHVRSISVDQLQSAVEQTLHRMQILHLEEGNHIEQHSLHR